MISFNISKVLIFYKLIFLYSLIFSHGFGSNTLIQLADGSKKSIYASCLHSLRNTIFVISYDIDQNCIINHNIKIGKKSTSNCYISLGFDGSTEDDIICTPTQEFYVSARHNWVSAYRLKIGDALLTKDLTTKKLTHKKFVPKSIKIYMLEIENTHTFFVGKHAILTHNIFLPLTASLGFVIPFGSVAAGTAGGFFGPIGIVGGIAFGGLCSIVIKALYENRIPRYKIPDFNISYIENSCTTIANYDEQIQNPTGCFIDQNVKEVFFIFPIENPLPSINPGCFEIQIHSADKQISTCNKNEIEKNNKSSCFQQPEAGNQFLYYSQEKPSEKKINIYSEKGQYNGPWYNRTEDWINENPFGQKIKKSLQRSQYTNQGKRAFKVIENIENCDGFKKGDYIVVDAMHKDHLEVFDKNQRWKQVASFDGSINISKTKQGMKESRRRLEG